MGADGAFITGSDVSDWVKANSAGGPIEKPAPMSATELTERKSQLSRRLQQVAHFVVNNPEDVAIYTIVEMK